MKNVSSRQVLVGPGALSLPRYHFRINSRQGKANGTADLLFFLPQRSLELERVQPLRSQPPRPTSCVSNKSSPVTPTFLPQRVSSGMLSEPRTLGFFIPFRPQPQLRAQPFAPLYQVLIYDAHVLSQRASYWSRIFGFFIPFRPQPSELNLTPLYQVLICGTHILPQPRQF